MAPAIRENGWNIAKLTFVIMAMSFGYTLYKDLAKRIDQVTEIQQHLADHVESDEQIHNDLRADITRINNYLLSENKK